MGCHRQRDTPGCDAGFLIFRFTWFGVGAGFDDGRDGFGVRGFRGIGRGYRGK